MWQHSKCHGLTPKKVEDPSFHFVCSTCKRKEEDAKKPKIAPLKLGKNRPSASPKAQRAEVMPEAIGKAKDSGLPPHIQRQLDGVYIPPAHQNDHAVGGPSLSPQGQLQGPPGYQHPPVSNFAPRAPQQPWQGQMVPPPSRPGNSAYSGGYARSPPGNGYTGSSPHQQQHQNAHQNAVQSAGGHPGHPGYQPQLTAQQSGSGSYAANGMTASPHPFQSTPSSMQPHDARRPSFPQHSYYPPSNYRIPQPPQQSQQQRRGSAQLISGYSSPAKPKSSASPPQERFSTPSQRLNHQPAPPRLAQSPQTSFPPPVDQSQQGVPSPAKSSPHPAPHHSTQSPALVSTPSNTLRPPSANGPNAFETPKMPNQPRVGIVADGMSGPWPEGSKAIPQKHDQSPAPPSSAHAVGEMKIVPPVAALAPSPSQEAAGATGSIPVKKLPGEGNVANSSP